MSNNKEIREYKDTVHLYLALQRPSKQGPGHKRCIRSVIKHDDDIAVFEAKIKAIGGEWRIYHTVNARSVEKAYKIFMKSMIDFPERASCADSIWRTALLQRECKVSKLFMLDIDTKDEEKLNNLWRMLVKDDIYPKGFVSSPNGYHIITNPFDTREICKLDYVTLLRDGYYYIKTVGEKNVQ